VRDLELVLAVASSGSTVRAAAALHVTQSAVSRGLLLAESKLGTALFERSGRGLIATAAGERLLAGAAPLLSQLIELEQHALAPADTLELRVVCECYTAYRWLPSALASLRLGSPRNSQLNVTLAIEHSQAPVAALLEGQVDVALLTTAKVRAPLLELDLFSDEIVFVVAAGHPLARRASLATRDLLDYPLITSSQTPEPERRWFLAQLLARAPAPAPARPRAQPDLRLPLTEAIMDAARAGMGIAVLSEWIAGPYLQAGDLVARRMRKQPLHRPWRIAFRREVGDGAKQLAAALAHAAPRIAPARG
jgi:LysR family transcriptional regulator for metE and metH